MYIRYVFSCLRLRFAMKYRLVWYSIDIPDLPIGTIWFYEHIIYISLFTYTRVNLYQVCRLFFFSFYSYLLHMLMYVECVNICLLVCWYTYTWRSKCMCVCIYIEAQHQYSSFTFTLYSVAGSLAEIRTQFQLACLASLFHNYLILPPVCLG